MAGARVAVWAGALAMLMNSVADAEDAPTVDWSGYFVGIYGGAAWTDADVDDTLFNPVPGIGYHQQILDLANGFDDYSFSRTIGVLVCKPATTCS